MMAMLVASRTAGMWFSVAMWAGTLAPAPVNAALLVSCTFRSKICELDGVDVEVGAVRKVVDAGGGEGGEIERMGEVGWLRGGEWGFTVPVVEMRAGLPWFGGVTMPSGTVDDILKSFCGLSVEFIRLCTSSAL